MRGFPLLNLLVALLLSGAVLWPLVRGATRASPASRDAAPVDEPAKNAPGVSSRVSLRLVHAARRVRLLAGDFVLHEWIPGAEDLLLEDSITLPISEGRSELTVQIEWPPGTPDTVAEFRVEPDGMPSRSVNVWGHGGSTEEIVAFTWKGGPG